MWPVPPWKILTTSGIFLLTHPVWDVTINYSFKETSHPYFYSHIPCGMWQIYATINTISMNFYSHIPCGMWQNLLHFVYCDSIQFLLTHPVWDVTAIRLFKFDNKIISTHTSRVGCDYDRNSCNFLISHFYSHIPCGMWPITLHSNSTCCKFLLTHPVWDVTMMKPVK